MSAPAVLPYTTFYRTHTCGELRLDHGGQAVKLSGAVDKYYDDGSFDLRDTYGVTRVKLGEKPLAMILESMNLPETPPDKRHKRMTVESVITVKGTVRPRPQPDEKAPTGAVFLEGTDLDILAPAKTPVIFNQNDEKLPAEQRRRHRYVYLRKPIVHEHLRFRTRLTADLRRFLLERSFLDVVTPLLSARWTPDQTDAFLSVRARAEVFALQGKRSNVGTLLMASGFDRTFEVGRRFQRLKAYGPFEQPEYTVLEGNLAYVEENDLVSLVSQLIGNIGKTTLGEPFGPIVKLTAAEAEEKYGTDRPDLRYGLELHDPAKADPPVAAPQLRELCKTGAVRLIRVHAARAGKLGDPGLDKLTAALGPQGLIARVNVTPEKTGDVPGGGLQQPAADELVQVLKAEPGDVLFAVAGRNAGLVSQVAGQLRAAIGNATGGARKNAFALITRLPYFRLDLAQNKPILEGDPLTRPVATELDGDPRDLHGLAFHIVLNGMKVGSGAVRNHDAGVQRELFDKLGLAAQEVSDRFGALIESYRFGVPPHARFVLGIDKLTALLRGLDSLDDVMAMPKNPDCSDGLTRAPVAISKGITRGLLGH